MIKTDFDSGPIRNSCRRRTDRQTDDTSCPTWPNKRARLHFSRQQLAAL